MQHLIGLFILLSSFQLFAATQVLRTGTTLCPGSPGELCSHSVKELVSKKVERVYCLPLACDPSLKKHLKEEARQRHHQRNQAISAFVHAKYVQYRSMICDKTLILKNGRTTGRLLTSRETIDVADLVDQKIETVGCLELDCHNLGPFHKGSPRLKWIKFFFENQNEFQEVSSPSKERALFKLAKQATICP